MREEKYTLNWHTYSDHLRDILKEMSSDDSFADVTLVTDDKKQIKAHRNILSACSSVFKEILQINSNISHPVIYLRGIQHSEMESLLQFIYLGEAKFYEERMNEFLNVAKNLDIRELPKSIEDGDESTAINEDNTGIDSEDVGEQSKQDIDGAAGAQNGAVTKGYKYECQQCDKAYYDSFTLRRHIKSAHEGVKYACNQCEQQFTQQNSLTTHIKSVHEGVKYACNQCDYRATQQSNLTTHIKSKHEGINYACDKCDYQAATLCYLTRHKQVMHDGVKYACNQCNYQATQMHHLKTHIKSRHEGVKYACNQCPYQGSKDALRHHLKQKHS